MQQEAAGHERDIRPLFREKDVSGGAEIVAVKRRRSNDPSMKAANEITPVPVAVVSSRIEAELIVGMLRSHGLRAVASADDAGGQDPQLQIQGVRVLVTPSDEASARRLLAATDDTPHRPVNPIFFSVG